MITFGPPITRPTALTDACIITICPASTPRSRSASANCRCLYIGLLSLMRILSFFGFPPRTLLLGPRHFFKEYPDLAAEVDVYVDRAGLLGRDFIDAGPCVTAVDDREEPDRLAG